MLLAKDEETIKGMIRKLENYLERKRLEVNTDKSKILRCKRGGGRKKKVSWRWKGKIIEEVKSYKYLGYTILANKSQEGHEEERVKKGAAILGQIWGIGKRKFGRDWSRRIWLFDRLVWSVVSYRVENVGLEVEKTSREFTVEIPEVDVECRKKCAELYNRKKITNG